MPELSLILKEGFDGKGVQPMSSSSGIGGTSTGTNSNFTQARPRSKNQVTDSGASATERDAQGRITQAQQSVTQAQQEANTELDQIRSQYDQKSELETANLDDSLDRQRLKGYEALRDLKRQQETELHRVKQEGDRDLAQAGNYYRDTKYATYRKGEEDVKELKEKQAQESQYTNKSGQLDYKTAKADQDRRLAELKDLQDHQYKEQNDIRSAKFEKLKADTEVANQRTAEHFQKSYDSTIAQDQASIDLLQNIANKQINSIRAETSQALEAYSSRQNDPFYKLKDIGAALHEYGDKFVITANIPKGEQDHITVALRGNQLVIQGTRHNEEHLDLGPGRMKGTSSYQTFEESLPLNWPVDGRSLSKQFQGDRMVITVNKASEFASQGVYKAPAPARLRAERPHLPLNLPTSESIKEESGSEKDSGSRPLT
jgi:HSP20 family molecular chaperone IbpA